MANDMEHLFMYLLAICMSSLEKFLFRSSTHFLIKIFVVIDLYHIFWVLAPYQIHDLQTSPI